MLEAPAQRRRNRAERGPVVAGLTGRQRWCELSFAERRVCMHGPYIGLGWIRPGRQIFDAAIG
jgi:hypothetical protein